MNPVILRNILECAVRRAHLYGASDCPFDRLRYFRELAAINALKGEYSPFAPLG